MSITDEELSKLTENFRQFNEMMPHILNGMSAQMQMMASLSSTTGKTSSAFSASNEELNKYLKNMRQYTAAQQAEYEADQKINREVKNNKKSAINNAKTSLDTFTKSILSVEKSYRILLSTKTPNCLYLHYIL